jgi:hypothetical protein
MIAATSAPRAAQRASSKRSRQSVLLSDARAGTNLPPTSAGGGLGCLRTRWPFSLRSGCSVGSSSGGGPSSSKRSFSIFFSLRSAS